MENSLTGYKDNAFSLGTDELLLPGRTLESIKGARNKNAEYKRILAERRRIPDIDQLNQNIEPPPATPQGLNAEAPEFELRTRNPAEDFIATIRNTFIRSTYGNLYSSASPDDNNTYVTWKTSSGTYYPISGEELRTCLTTMKNKSPGGDNMLLSHLKSLKDNYLLAILNVVLWERKQPLSWKKNETILIPKKQSGLENASNWRPITLSVTIVRLLHKILAARLSNSINLRQKAFIPVDGCAPNIVLFF